MWVLKIKLLDKQCIWSTRCKKFGIYNYQYPLGFYKVKNGLALVLYHILEGNEKAIKRYIKDVKKDKRVKELNVKGNVMISLAVEKRLREKLKGFEVLYNPKVIYLKPGINSLNGWEVWEIGAFDRKELEEIIKYAEEQYEGEVLYLKEIKVPKIFIPEIMPGLTDKQEEAFKLASESGYYEFPRKTNLHKLARLFKTSRPTFEEHLRKAEIKILSFMKELFLR